MKSAALSPSERKVKLNPPTEDILRNISLDRYEHISSIFYLHMDEGFECGKGKRSRSVNYTRPARIPATCATSRTLTAERSGSIFALGYTPYRSTQLYTPYSIRVSTSSTCSVPASVSNISSGTAPPSARLGLLSQFRAEASFSNTSRARAPIRARR